MTSEVEYLLPQYRGGDIAPSAFVSAAYGWNNSSNMMAGIRVYFGNHDKALIRRQREDDPASRVSNPSNYGSEAFGNDLPVLRWTGAAHGRPVEINISCGAC